MYEGEAKSDTTPVQLQNRPFLNLGDVTFPLESLPNQESNLWDEEIASFSSLSDPSQLSITQTERPAFPESTSLVLNDPLNCQQRNKFESKLPCRVSSGKGDGVNTAACNLLHSNKMRSRRSRELNTETRYFEASKQKQNELTERKKPFALQDDDRAEKEYREKVYNDESGPFLNDEKRRRLPRPLRLYQHPRIFSTLHTMKPLPLQPLSKHHDPNANANASPDSMTTLKTNSFAHISYPSTLADDLNASIVRELFSKHLTENKSHMDLQAINASLKASSRMLFSADSVEACAHAASLHSKEGRRDKIKMSLALPPIAATKEKLKTLFCDADERLSRKIQSSINSQRSICLPNLENRTALPSAGNTDHRIKRSGCHFPSSAFAPSNKKATSPINSSSQVENLKRNIVLQAMRKKEKIFEESCEVLRLLKLLEELIREEKTKRIELLGNSIPCQHPLPCVCVIDMLSEFERLVGKTSLNGVEVSSFFLLIPTVLEEYAFLQKMLLEEQQRELNYPKEIFETEFSAYFAYQRIMENEQRCWEHLMAFHKFCMHIASTQRNIGISSEHSIEENARTTPRSSYNYPHLPLIHNRDSPFCLHHKFIEFSIFLGDMERHEEIERKKIECEEAAIANKLIRDVSFSYQEAMIEEVHDTTRVQLLKGEEEEFACLLKNALEERRQIEPKETVRRETEDLLERIAEELKRLSRLAEETKVDCVACYKKEFRDIYVEAVKERFEMELNKHCRLSPEEKIGLANQWLLENAIVEQENSEEYQRNLLIAAELCERDLLVAMRDEFCRFTQMRDIYLQQEAVERSIINLFVKEYVQRQQIISKFLNEYETLFVVRLVPFCSPRFSTVPVADAAEILKTIHQCEGAMSPEKNACFDEKQSAKAAFREDVAAMRTEDSAAGMDLRRIVISDLSECLEASHIFRIFSM